ncbi:LysR family transcriptional regulator, partial [Nocardia gipuzkoensis]
MLDYAPLTSNPLTIRQIEYFVWSVKLGSKALAAKKFGVTPSAMSQQIAALESAIDRKLYDRASGRATLTRFGEIFFQHASGVVDSFHKTISACQTFNDDAITIGTTVTLASKLIPPIVYRMQREHGIKNVAVEPFIESRSLRTALACGVVDIAVGPLDAPPDGGISTVVGEEELVIACHRNRSAHLKGSWSDLAEQAWIGYSTQSDIDRIIKAESEREGVVLRYTATVQDVPTALSLAAHSIGVTLVPKMALKDSLPVLSAITLQTPIRRTISIQARDASPLVNRFLEVAGDEDLGRRLV